MMRYGLLAIIVYIVNINVICLSSIDHQPVIKLTNVIAEYFRENGVQSVIIVVCNANIDTTLKRHQLYNLIHSLNEENFYIRIFNGNTDERSEPEQLSNVHSYGPPPMFRSDNATRRRLDSFILENLFHKSGILFLNFETPCALNVLRWAAAPEHNYFKTNRFWLLLTETKENLQLLSNDEDIFLPPDSEVRILIWPTTERELYRITSTNFRLIDVYKISNKGRLKQHEIGNNFNSIGGMLHAIRIYGSAITYRDNLEGISFQTALVVAFPDVFKGVEDLTLRHIDTISKVNNRITLEMANKLNIRFNTFQTDNYGWRQPNGSFDGLMGRFQRYEIDFAQLAIFMRLDRIAECDFVAETYRVRAGIMFRQPPLSAVANIFAMPFDTYVWIAILSLIIITSFVFGLELFFSPYDHSLHFLDGVCFVWGAMCQQGFYAEVINRSARIIVFTTFVATLFLFTSFSANIVALLQSPSEAIRTLSDLSQSPLEIGMQETQYNKLYFTESTDPVTKRLYHKKIAPKGDKMYMRPLEGMKKMRSGLFAYQVELQAGYQIVSDTFSEPEKCGLKELEAFQLPMIAIPTRKNFPYKELFRRQLRWQREVGLMNREERKWFPQKPKCEGGVGGFVSIGLTECRYALAIFGYGMFFAFLIFILELLFRHFKSCRNKD